MGIYRDGSIDDDESKLKEIRKWAIENLLKMKKAFGDGLNKLWIS